MERRRNACKLLFRTAARGQGEEEAALLRDFTSEQVTVNGDIVEAGLALLRDGQRWLPSKYRRDGRWEISVL